METRVGIIQINVTDLELARLFYEVKLGFKPTASDGQVICYALGGDAVLLLYKVFYPAENLYPDGTGIVPVFYIEDIDQTYAEWKAKGVEFVKIAWSAVETGIAPCPFGRFIAVRDPFGNVFEILEPHKRAT